MVPVGVVSPTEVYPEISSPFFLLDLNGYLLPSRPIFIPQRVSSSGVGFFTDGDYKALLPRELDSVSLGKRRDDFEDGLNVLLKTAEAHIVGEE